MSGWNVQRADNHSDNHGPNHSRNQPEPERRQAFT